MNCLVQNDLDHEPICAMVVELMKLQVEHSRFDLSDFLEILYKIQSFKNSQRQAKCFVMQF